MLSKFELKLFTKNKNRFILLFIVVISNCLNIYSQSKYLIKDKEGFDFILNVNIDGNIISGFTRENALLDYASKLQFQLVKAASSLKHPEIIRFNGTLTNDNFEGAYDYLFSSYKIKGNIDADSISFLLYQDDNEVFKSLKGGKITNYIEKDYVKLSEQVIKVTEENIFDPKLMQSKKWKEFKTKIMKAAPEISDDLEFQTGFFALARKIGFSHYYIIPKITSIYREREKASLKEIAENTIMLKVGNFHEKKENIKPLLDTILQKDYKNLIIDIRDNSGGSFESVFLIANFLTDKEYISGFFPNRKWYEEYKRLPNKSDIDKFYLMTGEISRVDSDYGFYISTKGVEDNFKGKTYILTNKKTGSSAEALVIGAKEYNLATIIGEKTAGGLLNAKQFNIDDDIILIVPINDFISYNGFRVDQKGIKPDVELKNEKAIDQQILDITKKEAL